MKSLLFQKVLNILNMLQHRISYIPYTLTVNAAWLTFGPVVNAELIALGDIRDERHGSFYNIKTNSQVIFGNMSLSSELPAGMWRGISRTHHWPSMCLRVMDKHDPNRCQKQHKWHWPEEERGWTGVSEKSKQTVQNKKHKFTLRSCNLAELESPFHWTCFESSVMWDVSVIKGKFDPQIQLSVIIWFSIQGWPYDLAVQKNRTTLHYIQPQTGVFFFHTNVTIGHFSNSFYWSMWFIALSLFFIDEHVITLFSIRSSSTATDVRVFHGRTDSAGSSQMWYVRRSLRWLLSCQRPLLCLGWQILLPLLCLAEEVSTNSSVGSTNSVTGWPRRRVWWY